MDARLERLIRLPALTLGSLFIDGVWQCFTKEPPVREDRVYVAGESALPEGLYTVSLSHSKRFARVVPLAVSAQLLAAGGHRVALGMRFIPGHYTLDPELGIVVGETQAPKDVHLTRPAYEKLYERFRAAKDRCEAIELVIS